MLSCSMLARRLRMLCARFVCAGLTAFNRKVRQGSQSSLRKALTTEVTEDAENRTGIQRRGWDGSGGGPQVDLAAGAVSLFALHRGVSGSEQRGVCGVADAATARIHRRGVWAGLGNVFCWLFLFSGAQQPDAAAGGCAAVDCVADDGLGSDLVGDGFRQRAAQFLFVAISAGSGGGGILYGCHLLPEELVSGASSGADGGAIHDGCAIVGRGGWSGFGGASGIASDGGTGGMAMDVPVGGDPGGVAGSGGAAVSGGSSGGGGVAFEHRARMAAGHAAARAGRFLGRNGYVQRFEDGSHMDAGAGVFRTEYGFVWCELVVAQVDQELVGSNQSRGGIAVGDPVRGGGAGDGSGRVALG